MQTPLSRTPIYYLARTGAELYTYDVPFSPLPKSMNYWPRDSAILLHTNNPDTKYVKIDRAVEENFDLMCIEIVYTYTHYMLLDLQRWQWSLWKELPDA